MSNNLDQLTDWLKDHKITEVECMIADLTGITRGKISPTNKFIAEKGMRLPESVLLQTVTGDYVEDDTAAASASATKARGCCRWSRRCCSRKPIS
ncbi:hypothetical protein ACQKP4_28720, partial [Pseudomonas sp. NPDC086278]